MNKWEVLSSALQAEGGETFLLSRISPQTLKEAHEQKRGVIIEENGVVIACGFLWPTHDPKIWEPGTLWVAPSHRGKGHSTEVFRRRLELVPPGIQLFIISYHNPAVGRHALKNGFEEASWDTWFKTIPKEHTCGPCDRLAETDKLACPFRGQASECRLFVKAATADH